MTWRCWRNSIPEIREQVGLSMNSLFYSFLLLLASLEIICKQVKFVAMLLTETFQITLPNTSNANNAMINQLEFVFKWNMQHVASFNAICQRPGFCFYFWMVEKCPLYQRADWLMMMVTRKTAPWYFLEAWRPCHFPKDLWKLRYCKLWEFILNQSDHFQCL